MTELEAIHVVVPHAAYEVMLALVPDAQWTPAEGVGFVAPKWFPKIVTEVPPLDGAFVGV